MKKYLLVLLLTIFIIPSVTFALRGYIPTTISPCVNDSCRFEPYATSASAGDKISLVAQDLEETDKVTVGNTIIENWKLTDKYILEFFLPDNIKNDVTGYVPFRVYFSDGNLIAMGNFKIYSKPVLPPTPKCTADIWTCGNYGSCSVDGTQSRNCTKTFECSTDNTPSPATSQNCTPPPSCTVDIWVCDDWNSCSPSGIQNRSCKRTFDCPSVETAPPPIDQYCEAPNRPTQQIPQNSSNKISNQNTQKTTGQRTLNQVQKESTIVQPTEPKEEITPPANPEPVKRAIWYKRLWNWLFS
ncbi:MAG: hypothetical protein Q7K54_05690 [Candidatus Parcubacteria bacterium]|nr:hypothetical protein [Candidatus Parcubacteria bacterium]